MMDFDSLLDSLEIKESAPIIASPKDASVEVRIEKMRDLLKEINKLVDIDLIINVAMDHIASEHQECALYLVDEESVFYSKIWRNIPEGRISQLCEFLRKLDITKGIDALAIEITQLDDLVFHLHPLISNNELFGYLALGNSKDAQPDMVGSDFADILTAQIAILIEKSQLYGTIVHSQDQLDIKIEELQALYDELLTLYDFSQSASSLFELDDLLNLALDNAHKAVEAEKTMILTLDSEKGVVYPRKTKGWDRENLKGEYPIANTVLNMAMGKKVAIIANNFFSHENFAGLNKMGFEAKDMLIVPIILQNEVFGFILIGARRSNKPYSSQHQRLLSSMAAQVARGIENIRLYAEYVEKQKIQRDLDVAHEIQTSLLPAKAPKFDCLELCGYSEPAREVGGDFYDFIELSQDRVGVVIGDVSGKGIPAALLMAMTKSVIRSEASSARSLSSAFFRVNNIISHDMISGKFVTISYLVFHHKTGKINMVSAGHHPPVVFRFQQEIFETYTAEGLPIGIIEDAQFEENSFEIGPKDTVILCTDGVLEAMNEKHEEYGQERFYKVIKNSKSLSLEELKVKILEDISLFVGNAPKHDDTTLVLARRVETAKPNVGIARSFRINSEMGKLQDIIEEIDRTLLNISVPSNIRFDIKLIVNELVVNAISHGNKLDPEKSVHISYAVGEKIFKMCLKDEGEGIDLSDLNRKMTEESLENENGRGIFLVRELTDNFAYNHETNEIILEKKW